VCGEFHDFYLCQGELVTDQRYNYRCPVTGQTGFLWNIPRVEAVAEPPAEGVPLWPTGTQTTRLK
jgi:hypothetical protein